MGKPTGFMEYERKDAYVVPENERIGNFEEFHTTPDVKDQQIQQQSDRIGDLTAALRAAQDQNKELTTALTAAQALNAGTMQMLMEKATPETVTASQREDVPESIPTPQPQQEPLRSPQDAAAPSESEPQQHKPRLFARLFRKKEKA